MKTLIFLNCNQFNFQKIRSSGNKPLEINQNWLLSLKLSLNICTGDHNLFVIVSDVEWSYQTMICSKNCIRSSFGHNKINIIEFISFIYYCCYKSFSMKFLQSVSLLSFSNWIEIYFYIWERSISYILFSHFFGSKFHSTC